MVSTAVAVRKVASAQLGLGKHVDHSEHGRMAVAVRKGGLLVAGNLSVVVAGSLSDV